MPYNIAIGIMQVTAIVSILINIKTIMSQVRFRASFLQQTARTARFLYIDLDNLRIFKQKVPYEIRIIFKRKCIQNMSQNIYFSLLELPKHECKARFPLTYFAATGEKFRHRKSSFVVLSRHQRKVKQKLKNLSNCSRRTNFFSSE